MPADAHATLPLPGLSPVTTLAIDVLVDPARGPVREVGGDEARVGALRAGLDAGDDALDTGPAGGAVVEFLVAAQLLPACRAGVAPGGAGFQRLDMAAQGRGGGDAEQEVDARRAAEIQHLRRAVVAVSADQDLDPRPVPADLADQAAQDAARLGAGRALGRA